MLCCLMCVDGARVPGSKLNPFYSNPDHFQIGMMESCWKSYPWCVFGCVCACCAHFIVRKRALDNDLDNYLCCQGYYRLCRSRPDGCGERKCPRLSLCLESFACICCAVKSSRMYLMEKFKLQPDPWDNRVIRFRDGLVMTFGWICMVGDYCIDGFGLLIYVNSIIADLVYISGAGCLMGQMVVEMRYHGGNAPSAATIVGR